MLSKRLLLAKLLEKTGATRAMLALRRRARSRWLPIVTFHRVLAPPRGSPYLFDEGVIDASPEDFERYVRVISLHFTPIGIDDVIDSVRGARLPRNPILVTFDDGYKDNHEVVLPILERHGVKAVFFVATHYLTHRRVFWWDRINYLLKTSRRRGIRISYPSEMELALDAANRAASIDLALRVVKDRVGLDLERFLEHVAEAADVPWTDELDRRLAERLLMTWDEVRRLRRAGMEVQSHTRTHRGLQTLSEAELRSELKGSRDDLERELDTTVHAISFPFGHRLGGRDDIREQLGELGYKLGFTNATGTHRVGRTIDPYDIRRIAFDAGTPEALFRAMLAAPPLFG
jgi:peptidoglycan/xylan/chitin deacetylase (PgdA/CDA1 family)